VILDNCDLLPFRAEKVPGDVGVTFGFDLAVVVGFVTRHQTVWSNEAAPILLSELIRDHAEESDLVEMASDLAIRLMRKKAAAEIATGG